MNVLKEITPPEAGRALVIFYDYCSMEEKWDQGRLVEGEWKKESSHCEMFMKADLSGVVLNDNSFTLRFRARAGSGSVKFHFSDEGQVKQLAGLLEHCLGQGLRVKEQYATLKINSVIKNL